LRDQALDEFAVSLLMARDRKGLYKPVGMQLHDEEKHQNINELLLLQLVNELQKNAKEADRQEEAFIEKEIASIDWNALMHKVNKKQGRYSNGSRSDSLESHRNVSFGKGLELSNMTSNPLSLSTRTVPRTMDVLSACGFIDTLSQQFEELLEEKRDKKIVPEGSFIWMLVAQTRQLEQVNLSLSLGKSEQDRQMQQYIKKQFFGKVYKLMLAQLYLLHECKDEKEAESHTDVRYQIGEESFNIVEIKARMMLEE
jgi:hypothetical protein